MAVQWRLQAPRCCSDAAERPAYSSKAVQLPILPIGQVVSRGRYVAGLDESRRSAIESMQAPPSYRRSPFLIQSFDQIVRLD
jgi:hypothetical protein